MSDLSGRLYLYFPHLRNGCTNSSVPFQAGWGWNKSCEVNTPGPFYRLGRGCEPSPGPKGARPVSPRQGLGLQLVLLLGGCVEVLEHRLQELEGGPLLWPVPPALGDDTAVQLGRARVGARHAVAALHAADDLGVAHSCRPRGRRARLRGGRAREAQTAASSLAGHRAAWLCQRNIPEAGDGLLSAGQFLRVWDPVLLIGDGHTAEARPSLGRCSVKTHQPAEGHRSLQAAELPKPFGGWAGGLGNCTVRIGLPGVHPRWKAKGETTCPQVRTNQLGVNLSSDTDLHLILGLGVY